MLIVIVTWSTLYFEIVSTWSGSARPLVDRHSLMSGAALGDQLEGLEGLLRVCERVAGAGDAEHRHLRNRRGHREHLLRRLLGRELLADDAGARLVGAIVFAIAVVALDIAGRRDRDVHARVVMMRLFAVAGMVLDLFPDLGGRSLAPAPEPQLALPRRRCVPHPLCSADCCIDLILDAVAFGPCSGLSNYLCHCARSANRRREFAGFAPDRGVGMQTGPATHRENVRKRTIHRIGMASTNARTLQNVVSDPGHARVPRRTSRAARDLSKRSPVLRPVHVMRRHFAARWHRSCLSFARAAHPARP